jgi:predicted transcriptional regulator
MDPLNQIIFDDKSFSDLLKEIHKNQSKKAKQLASLIAELRPLITNLGDATVVVPLIKEYMEISVKNDDQLIKMAAIVQRLSTGASNTGDSGLLTEEEMEQLQSVAEEISKTVEKPKQLNEPKDEIDGTIKGR